MPRFCCANVSTSSHPIFRRPSSPARCAKTSISSQPVNGSRASCFRCSARPRRYVTWVILPLSLTSSALTWCVASPAIGCGRPAGRPGPGELPRSRRGLLLGQRAEKECQVGGTLSQPSHEVPVPLVAERHIDAHLIARVSQSPLLVVTDAVEHLLLEIISVPPGFASHVGDGVDDHGVM